jgi:2,4-dienoyl-CoA reductase-like NADH-dependent reductase (Old Yellow Enzyme family)
MREVMDAADNKIAVLVKTNTRDGFKGGLEVDECITVAQKLQDLGAHCLVLSGGFVSRAPMYVMKGKMPMRTLWGYMPWKSLWWLKIGIALFGKLMIRNEPFEEAFFYDDSVKFRKALPDMPLAFVGGLNSADSINKVLDAGFDFIEMARPLVYDTQFINKLKAGTCSESGCKHSNYCVARIWNYDMQCHENCKLSPYLSREIERNIKNR